MPPVRQLLASSSLVFALVLSACPSTKSTASRLDVTPGCGKGVPCSVRVAAAGDVSLPALGGQVVTYALLADAGYDAVLALGDLQYPKGERELFEQFFHSSWGQLGDRLKPVPGNHEYGTPGAQGYFAYFGARAGPEGKGYYSFDLGPWHFVALNSSDGECKAVACGPGSEQITWLEADLAKSHAKCTVAYWHHPRFSSGPHGNNAVMETFWRTLEKGGADLVLTGHDHLYERFAPQHADGAAADDGLRSFVVGTGGATLYPLRETKANSEVRVGEELGVLELTLRAADYSWRFLPARGGPALDQGSARCR